MPKVVDIRCTLRGSSLCSMVSNLHSPSPVKALSPDMTAAGALGGLTAAKPSHSSSGISRAWSSWGQRERCRSPCSASACHVCPCPSPASVPTPIRSHSPTLHFQQHFLMWFLGLVQDEAVAVIINLLVGCAATLAIRAVVLRDAVDEMGQGASAHQVNVPDAGHDLLDLCLQPVHFSPQCSHHVPTCTHQSVSHVTCARFACCNTCQHGDMTARTTVQPESHSQRIKQGSQSVWPFSEMLSKLTSDASGCAPYDRRARSTVSSFWVAMAEYICSSSCSLPPMRSMWCSTIFSPLNSAPKTFFVFDCGH